MPVYILRSVCASLTVILLAGCASTGAPVQAGKLQFYRGQVSPEGDHWVMALCYSRQNRVLTDPEGALAARYSEQQPYPGLPIYMELEASERAEVRRVRLAGGDSRACAAELDGIRLRVAGTDPAWDADLSGDRLEVRDQARLMRLGFRVEERTSRSASEPVWFGRMKAPAGGEHKVELSLEQSGCRDSLGIWYGLTVVMRLDGRLYKGCGRYGDLARQALAGRYGSSLVSEAGPVHTLVLELTPDGAAQLTEDYHDGQPAIVRTGSWRWLPSRKLMLHFLQRDDQAEQQVRLFHRRPDGTLVQEGRRSESEGPRLRLSRE